MEYRVDETRLETPVPALILPPVVENAIRHGLARKIGPCHLLIRVEGTSEGLVLEVVDDGLGTAVPTPVNGVGLRNVRARLRAHYEDRHRFVFRSEPGKGTSIRMLLGCSIA